MQANGSHPISTRADGSMSPRPTGSSTRTSPHTSSSGTRATSSLPVGSRRPYPQPAFANVGIQPPTAGTDGTAHLFPASTGGWGCSLSTTTSSLPATLGSRTPLLCVNTVSTCDRIRRDEDTTVGCDFNQPITQVVELLHYH